VARDVAQHSDSRLQTHRHTTTTYLDLLAVPVLLCCPAAPLRYAAGRSTPHRHSPLHPLDATPTALSVSAHVATSPRPCRRLPPSCPNPSPLTGSKPIFRHPFVCASITFRSRLHISHLVLARSVPSLSLASHWSEPEAKEHELTTFILQLFLSRSAPLRAVTSAYWGCS
jgi:hypothetical protein